jgi:hypothetical protein
MLSALQIAMRREGVGASELFDVLNNPYRLWHQKVTGKSPFTGHEDFIRMGNLFERPTAEDYVYRRAQSGSPVRLLTTQTATGEAVTLQDPDRPWFCGTPDFLPMSIKGHATYIAHLGDLWALRDCGLLDRGLEIKTGAAVAELHLEEDDQWGQGFRAPIEDVLLLLEGRCSDPMAVARDLMARFSLQHHIGAEAAQSEDDQWGDAGTSQMPRRYLAQCAGYMALTGLDRWDLHRLRFGFGRIETVTYTVLRDLELEGLLLDAAARFVRDHLKPQKPPAQVKLDDRFLEVARLFPRENGVIRPALQEEDVLLERYRSAVIEAERADVRKDWLEAYLVRAIGADKGIVGGAGKVAYGARKGRTSINAQAAVSALVDALRAEGVQVSEEMIQQALAAGTKEGEGFRAISRPQAWTKGLEAQVLAELEKETQHGK